MLQTFVDPSLTAYEAEKQRLNLNREKGPPPKEASEIFDIIECFQQGKHHGEWVFLKATDMDIFNVFSENLFEIMYNENKTNFQK